LHHRRWDVAISRSNFENSLSFWIWKRCHLDFGDATFTQKANDRLVLHLVSKFIDVLMTKNWVIDYSTVEGSGWVRVGVQFSIGVAS